MDNTVTQEVFKRIDALAEKLGTTAAYLWPKLVAWEYGRAIAGILSSLIFAAIGGIVIWHVLPICKKSWDRLEGPIVSTTFVCIGGAIVFLLGAIAFCFGLERWIATLYSPEAAAFYRLVGK